jgi:transposase-like protein
VKGRWTHLYRALDRDGNLVEVYLSERRDRAAAEAFFRSARTVTEQVADRVTTAGHDSDPGAIKADLNVIDYDALEVSRSYLVDDLTGGAKRLMQTATGYTATVAAG